MTIAKPKGKQRQRATSQRALDSRARILDAAERVFAQQGFDAASIREIATEADAPVGLVHHHGGGKAALFEAVVARRATELSRLRLAALAQAQQANPATLESLLRAFILPYLEQAENGGAQWLAYARIVAMVSADDIWADLLREHFDPTAARFIDAIAALHPDTPRTRIAQGFVYSVAAMLAFLTARWRIGALSGDASATGDVEGLLRFVCDGFAALLADPCNIK